MARQMPLEILGLMKALGTEGITVPPGFSLDRVIDVTEGTLGLSQVLYGHQSGRTAPVGGLIWDLAYQRGDNWLVTHVTSLAILYGMNKVYGTIAAFDAWEASGAPEPTLPPQLRESAPEPILAAITATPEPAPAPVSPPAPPAPVPLKKEEPVGFFDSLVSAGSSLLGGAVEQLATAGTQKLVSSVSQSLGLAPLPPVAPMPVASPLARSQYGEVFLGALPARESQVVASATRMALAGAAPACQCEAPNLATDPRQAELRARLIAFCRSGGL